MLAKPLAVRADRLAQMQIQIRLNRIDRKGATGVTVSSGCQR